MVTSCGTDRYLDQRFISTRFVALGPATEGDGWSLKFMHFNALQPYDTTNSLVRRVPLLSGRCCWAFVGSPVEPVGRSCHTVGTPALCTEQRSDLEDPNSLLIAEHPSLSLPKRSAVSSAEYRVHEAQDTRSQRNPKPHTKHGGQGCTWYINPRYGLPPVRGCPGDIIVRTTLKGPSRDGEEQLCLSTSRAISKPSFPAP